MNYVVIDLEATCWPERTKVADMEIIEIGAVKLSEDRLQAISEYSRFIRPIANPVLTDFCTNLTTISQQEVDRASPFPIVLEDFLKWIGEERITLCSWGNYDIEQLKADCKRHHLRFPNQFNRHLNLKEEFARQRGSRPCGYMAAMNFLNIHPAGTHHRGIDDARNIAEIAQRVIPRLNT